MTKKTYEIGIVYCSLKCDVVCNATSSPKNWKSLLGHFHFLGDDSTF